MQVGDLDGSFSGSGSDLVVLTEAARVVEPTESALDDPAPRSLLKISVRGAFCVGE